MEDRHSRQREGKEEAMMMALNSKEGCRRNVYRPGKLCCVYSVNKMFGAVVNVASGLMGGL